MGKPMTRIIHMKHFAFFIIKKWYWLLLGILIGVVSFSVIGVVNIKQQQKDVGKQSKEKEIKIKVSDAEFYNVLSVVECEVMLAEKKRYVDNSIRMQIDPFHRWDCTDIYTIVPIESQTPITPSIVVVEYYLDLLSSQEFYETLSSQTQNKIDAGYLKEVITTNVVTENQFSFSVCYPDKEQLRDICNIIDEYLLQHTNTVEEFKGYELKIEKGEPSESVDNGLIDIQNGMRSEVLALQDVVAYRLSLLTENELAYLELYRTARFEADYEAGQELTKTIFLDETAPITLISALKKYIKNGAIVGIVVVVLILFGVYVFHPCLLNPENVKDMLKVHLLNDGKQIPAIIGNYDIVAYKIEANIPQEKRERVKILFTGSIINDADKEMVKQLKIKLESLGIDILVASFLQEHSEEINKLKQVDQVVFLERVGESRWENLIWQISLCEESGKDINGVLLI